MNPFKYGQIVSGEYFYDREDELSRLKSTLIGGNNLVLYAPRRYGKSSLVNKVLTELKNEGFVTVYIDFMSIYSRELFIKNYSKAIAENEQNPIEKTAKKISKLIRGIIPTISFNSQGNPEFSFSWIDGAEKVETLEDLINLPEKFASSKKRWIISFDEFQEITKLNGESFEKILRSLIQHHKNVSYLFLGSRTHLLKDMFSNKNRAFYNSAMLMNLDTIDEKYSIKFLRKQFSKDKIKISTEVAEYLIEKSNAIPYYIQFIAAEIWQQVINKKEEIDKNHIDEAIKTIIELKSDYYWELTSKQTNYRKKVIRALCNSPNRIFSREITEKFNLGANSTTQKAINSFIEDGIIEQFNNKYEFSDPIYKLFLLKYL
ncbi:MAG: ATP-binding protein [Bacteroidetes bacterium]|nr:ATP-binding protein [Bacteroidota bacterium]MBU1678311.1 ATP-binding protein [Bacteroidota bacterium]MBU2507160.1 ATP-binding protein [Bacteroidota bacterium]